MFIKEIHFLDSIMATNYNPVKAGVVLGWGYYAASHAAKYASGGDIDITVDLTPNDIEEFTTSLQHKISNGKPLANMLGKATKDTIDGITNVALSFGLPAGLTTLTNFSTDVGPKIYNSIRNLTR